MTKEPKPIDSSAPRSKDSGEVRVSQDVVARIAMIVADKTDGIHALGKSSLLPFTSSKGVEAEVGKTQAALDLEVVIEFGCDLRAVVAKLRREIAVQVDLMTGRQVVEINVDVVGIHVPDEPKEEVETPRRVE